MFRGMLTLASLFTCVGFVGCGSGVKAPEGVVVTGKIVQGGSPVSIAPTPDGYNGVHVHFVPTFGAGSGTADTEEMCDASGNFKLVYLGDGLPPGKYKVAIALRQGGPETDQLSGKLSPDSTTIEVDVPKDKLGGTHDVGTIDIATYLK